MITKTTINQGLMHLRTDTDSNTSIEQVVIGDREAIYNCISKLKEI